MSVVSRIPSSTRTSKVGLDRARQGHNWVDVVRVRLALWGTLSLFLPLGKISDFVHMSEKLGSLCSDGPGCRYMKLHGRVTVVLKSCIPNRRQTQHGMQESYM